VPSSDQPERDAPALEWVSPVTPELDRRMAADGRHLVRLLHQMRRPLPLDAPARGGDGRLAVRPFDPDRDVDEWLGVNNRAFRWHPDQGGWDRARLEARLAEPWVDLDGFLVHDGAGGALDGFCWTRVHPATDADPALGEIYVIAADPDRHRPGLGRALTAAGLDHLTSIGLEVGMLYVEATNTAALRLYERMGFVVDHSDAAYADADAAAAADDGDDGDDGTEAHRGP
jgi:mycothiol synthase